MATCRLDRAKMQLHDIIFLWCYHASETLGVELLNGIDYFLGTCLTNLEFL